jgi:hypothetical protein
MQFPEQSITNEESDLMDKEVSVSEKGPELALGSESEFSALELVEDFSESVHEGESIPDVTEGLPPMNHPIGEILEVEYFPGIDQSHQDPMVEDPKPAHKLYPSVASRDLSPCDEQPTNLAESIPVIAPPRRELPLSRSTIRVTELAGLLGIRGYEVLRDLVELEHFVKTTDSVSAELAVKVGLKHGVDFAMTESVAKAEGRKNGVFSPTPTSADCDNMTFQIKNGLHVHAGDWIRDSQLGLGRILKLNTDPDEPDRHQVWFIGNTEEGTVVERHAIHSSTLGIIDPSMIPDDIRSAAPEIC